MAIPGFGGAFKQDVRESRPWQISIGGGGGAPPPPADTREPPPGTYDTWTQ